MREVRSIVHLQPIIPHYREEFFDLLSKRVHQDIYIYENVKDAQNPLLISVKQSLSKFRQKSLEVEF